MDDTITWLIIALFYAPLHFLVPVLVTLFHDGGEPSQRSALKATLIDCTLSMSLGFALVIVIARDRLPLAMGILLLSMFLPYIRLLSRKPTPK